MLSAVMWWLQRDRRVTYRTLKHLLGLDDALLQEIREELTFRRLIMDEDGKGLVWTGEAPPVLHTPGEVPSQPAPTDTMVVRPLTTPPDEPSIVSEPARMAPEAERRHLTVMFCDLVDSTRLSRHLDAEDYRAVVRTYQEAAVTAMQPWDGYVAQYLGDGLMVYFGWPTAHEDA